MESSPPLHPHRSSSITYRFSAMPSYTSFWSRMFGPSCWRPLRFGTSVPIGGRTRCTISLSDVSASGWICWAMRWANLINNRKLEAILFVFRCLVRRVGYPSMKVRRSTWIFVICLKVHFELKIHLSDVVFLELEIQMWYNRSRISSTYFDFGTQRRRWTQNLKYMFWDWVFISSSHFQAF